MQNLMSTTTPVPPALKSGLRTKIRLFTLLICIALFSIPLIAILLYAVNVSDTIICSGTVVPEHTYDITAPFDGPVKSICFHTGDKVKKGDLLVQLDDTVYVNEAGKIEAEIAVLNSELQVKKDDLLVQLDETEYVNDARKIEAEIGILEAQLQLKQGEFEVLKVEPLNENYRHAAARLESAQGAYDAAKTNYEKYKPVLTPIEFTKYEKEMRDTSLELAIRKENVRVVNNGMAEKILAKSASDIEITKRQITEKKVSLDILRKKIGDCHSVNELVKDLKQGKKLPDVQNGFAAKMLAKTVSDIEVTRHQIVEKQESLKTVRKKINDCRIVAPEDGTVLKIPCKRPRFAAHGEPAVIMGSLELMVRAEVDSRFIRKVRLDQEATISSDIFSKLQYGTFAAIVEKIDDVPMEGTGSTIYPVYLSLNTEECDIKIGSKAEVRIFTGTARAIYAFLNISQDDETAKRLHELRKRKRAGKETPPAVQKQGDKK